MIVKKQILSVFLVTATTYGLVLFLSVNPNNPDWIGYKAIYETGGAWLKDDGRDPLFLFIVNIFRELFGDNGYVNFRIGIAVYFFFFILLLASGNVINPAHRNASFTFILAALLTLGYLRFTIQIREGLALSLILVAIGILLNKDRAGRLRSIFAHCLIIIAPLIHIGTLAILLAYGLAMWVHRERSKIKTKKLKLNLIWVAIILAVLFFVVQVTQNIHIGAGLNDRAREREVHQSASIIQQYLKVGFYWILSYLSYREVKKNKFSMNSRVYSLLFIMTGPIQLALLLSVVSSISLDFSRLITGDLTRQFIMIFNVSCLLLAFHGARNKILAFGVFATMIDGLRAVIISITEHGGI